MVCDVDFDCILKPNKQLYVPKVSMKSDLGLPMLSVKEVKAANFWLDNVLL